MQLFLSKEEKFHLEAIMAKRNNLVLQEQLLQGEMNNVIAEFCKKKSVKIEDVKNLDLENGFIEFEERDEKSKANTKKR
jgi:hypothetical protein